MQNDDYDDYYDLLDSVFKEIQQIRYATDLKLEAMRIILHPSSLNLVLAHSHGGNSHIKMDDQKTLIFGVEVLVCADVEKFEILIKPEKKA